jgi:D-sedoheptulose 7-phosphate isomerase
MPNYYLTELLEKYNELNVVKIEILQTFNILKDCFTNGGTLYICGNGGSAADAEHIVGELMKSFMLPRVLKNEKFISKSKELYGKESEQILPFLQEGLRAVSLTGHPSLSTAFSNDVKPDMVFAQQLYILAKPGDVFLGISTSGNSSNVFKAFQVANSLELETVLFTGKNGGKCSKIVGCSIKAPSDIVYRIQEYHLPIYHTLCLMLEEYFYGEKSEGN